MYIHISYLEKLVAFVKGENDAKRQNQRKIDKTKPKSKEKFAWTAGVIFLVTVVISRYDKNILDVRKT